MNSIPRVVVTGIAVCAPNGIGLQNFETNTLRGVSACRLITGFPIAGKFSQVAGMIDDFESDTSFSDFYLKNTDYVQQDKTQDVRDRQQCLAEFCLKEILLSANLQESQRNNIPLILATAIGPMISMEYAFIKKNIHKRLLSSLETQVFSFRNSARNLSKKFRLSPTQIVLPTGCVGGCDSILYGLEAIRKGTVERVIVGASEAPITPLVMAAFGQINATSTRNCPPMEASCPFDSERDGFVLGEGAAFLLLESEEAAKKRQVPILAEIKGAASVNNCLHMTDIAADGFHIKESCRLALEDANLSVKDIDYINAHGSSTIQNDLAESNAFCMLFGKNIDNIPVTALKSQVGHALAAASAIETISVVQTLNSQKIPPTINLKNQDKNCSLQVVKHTPLNHRIRNVLKTSSGFSGIHTAIVVGEYAR